MMMILTALSAGISGIPLANATGNGEWVTVDMEKGHWESGEDVEVSIKAESLTSDSYSIDWNVETVNGSSADSGSFNVSDSDGDGMEDYTITIAGTDLHDECWNFYADLFADNGTMLSGTSFTFDVGTGVCQGAGPTGPSMWWNGSYWWDATDSVAYTAEVSGLDAGLTYNLGWEVTPHDDPTVTMAEDYVDLTGLGAEPSVPADVGQLGDGCYEIKGMLFDADNKEIPGSGAHYLFEVGNGVCQQGPPPMMVDVYVHYYDGSLEITSYGYEANQSSLNIQISITDSELVEVYGLDMDFTADEWGMFQYEDGSTTFDDGEYTMEVQVTNLTDGSVLFESMDMTLYVGDGGGGGDGPSIDIWMDDWPMPGQEVIVGYFIDVSGEGGQPPIEGPTFVCGDGEEIYFSWVNDGMEDCADGSDEPQDMDDTVDSDGDGNFTNDHDSWFDCNDANGSTVNMDVVNDGNWDCENGADEGEAPPPQGGEGGEGGEGGQGGEGGNEPMLSATLNVYDDVDMALLASYDLDINDSSISIGVLDNGEYYVEAILYETGSDGESWEVDSSAFSFSLEGEGMLTGNASLDLTVYFEEYDADMYCDGGFIMLFDWYEIYMDMMSEHGGDEGRDDGGDDEEPTIEELMELFDFDGDGVITVDDIIDTINQIEAEEGGDSLSEEDVERINAKFTDFDSNGNGELEADEFGPFLEALDGEMTGGDGGDLPTPEDFVEWFDTDGDDALTLDEIINGINDSNDVAGEPHMSEEEEDWMEEAFNEADENSDGLLDLDELVDFIYMLEGDEDDEGDGPKPVWMDMTSLSGTSYQEITLTGLPEGDWVVVVWLWCEDSDVMSFTGPGGLYNTTFTNGTTTTLSVDLHIMDEGGPDEGDDMDWETGHVEFSVVIEDSADGYTSLTMTTKVGMSDLARGDVDCGFGDCNGEVDADEAANALLMFELMGPDGGGDGTEWEFYDDCSFDADEVNSDDEAGLYWCSDEDIDEWWYWCEPTPEGDYRCTDDFGHNGQPEHDEDDGPPPFVWNGVLLTKDDMISESMDIVGLVGMVPTDESQDTESIQMVMTVVFMLNDSGEATQILSIADEPDEYDEGDDEGDDEICETIDVYFKDSTTWAVSSIDNDDDKFSPDASGYHHATFTCDEEPNENMTVSYTRVVADEPEPPVNQPPYCDVYYYAEASDLADFQSTEDKADGSNGTWDVSIVEDDTYWLMFYCTDVDGDSITVNVTSAFGNYGETFAAGSTEGYYELDIPTGSSALSPYTLEYTWSDGTNSGSGTVTVTVAAADGGSDDSSEETEGEDASAGSFVPGFTAVLTMTALAGAFLVFSRRED